MGDKDHQLHNSCLPSPVFSWHWAGIDNRVDMPHTRVSSIDSRGEHEAIGLEQSSVSGFQHLEGVAGEHRSCCATPNNSFGSSIRFSWQVIRFTTSQSIEFRPFIA